MSKPVFTDFAEYWSYAKFFNNKQRRAILRSLPKSQREKLESSYRNEGWEDLFVRNSLDQILDQISNDYGVGLLAVRSAALAGKSVFVKKKFWDYVIRRFKGFSSKHTNYILGGFRAVESELSADEVKLVPVEGR